MILSLGICCSVIADIPSIVMHLTSCHGLVLDSCKHDWTTGCLPAFGTMDSLLAKAACKICKMSNSSWLYIGSGSYKAA